MRIPLIVLAVILIATPILASQEFTDGELALGDFLVLPRVGRYGRVTIHVDPVAAQIAKGTWKAPQVGDEVTSADNKQVSWSKVDLTSERWLEHEALHGGYAYTQVTSLRRQVVMLEATGHAMVFVNGEPRAGDPYLTGRTIMPILLKQGLNEFLFHAAAGKLRAKLVKPQTEVFFDTRDLTAPTLVRGENEPVWIGMLLVNCRERPVTDAQLTASLAGGNRVTTKVDSVPALGVRKVAVPLMRAQKGKTRSPDEMSVKISLSVEGSSSDAEFEIQVADSDAPQSRTFLSGIDGSVQSYRLLPAKVNSASASNGLLVTLHDNNESAAEHLDKFAAAEGVHLLAPEGRRAEGCDWEDWSARDVLEALDDAAKHVEFDSKRVWLRGTATGGHGVLRLGGIAPDRWAALSPRSPWLEYPAGDTSDDETPIIEMLQRVAWSNRLTPLLRNTVGSGILLEASGTQENPAEAETREVLDALKAFHPDFKFKSLADETDSSDLSDVLEFSEQHAARDRKDVEEVDIVTYNPGLVAKKHWLTILSQHEQGSLTRAAVKFDPERKLFVGLTANVAMLEIVVSHLEMDTIVEVALDGEAVGEFAVDGKVLQFLRNPEGWHVIPPLPGSFKQPSRYGGIRSAFENRAVLVYGTRGSAEENAWALAKARYDAETILVRLNGSVDVMADTAFQRNSTRDRNIVLYGNADTNAAWPRLLSDSPVQVRREGVWVERRPELGDDLACVFIRPRRRPVLGSGARDTAVVGVVSGSGITGMRATDRLPLFVNGVVFPDLLLFSAESLTEGNADVRAAGFFGRVWAVDPGEIEWRDAAL